MIHASQEDQLFKAPSPAQPFPWWPTRPFRWQIMPDGSWRHPDHVGPAAVWTRPDVRKTVHALAMQEQGILTVAEVDDNYLSPWHLNMFMRQNGYREPDRLAHLRSFSMFDRVICSTRWLADTYRKAFKREVGHAPEIRVCRNHVDLDEWPRRVPDGGRLRVGWMGSPQHARDIKLAFPAFRWARENGCEVVIVGHDVRDETGVTHPRALEACRAWRSVITRHVPWIDPAEYHRTGLPLDVCVVPLERNEHTLGKSDIKALEAWMSGAAVVASASTVYDDAVKHGERGFLASSRDEFVRYVRLLVESRRVREETVAAGQEYVRLERSLQKVGRFEWMEAVTP